MLRPIHRLDADITEVLILARHPASPTALSRAFSWRRVVKIYWAVCQETRPSDRWIYEEALPDERNELGRTTTDSQEHPARTTFRLMRVAMARLF